MPKIEVSRMDMERLSGCAGIADSELETLLASLKAELKVSGDILKIELNDTNRPDLWCVEGVARGIAALLGRTRRYLAGLPEPAGRLEVDGSTAAVRPWIAAFTAKGAPLDPEGLASLIAAQEKLAASFGRNRKTAAIGFYRLGEVSFPVRYLAVEPDSVRFTPLGCDREMTLREILAGTETGARYAHLLEGRDLFPILADSAGEILSFPPVINSDGTGRVREGDDGLFCEVTGTDWNTVHLAAAILACNLEDRGWGITPVEIVHDRVLPPGGTRVTTPVRFCDTLSTTADRIVQVLGLLPESGEIAGALERMGWDGCESGPDGVSGRMPPYRHDGLHEVDLIEDIAIGYGMERFEPLMPVGYTIGSAAPVEDLADALRHLLAGAGCEELILPVLSSDCRPGTPPGIVRIENPMTLEYGAVRNSLLPGLLSAEAASAHAPYPHRIFEVGEVLEDGDRGIRTVMRAAVCITGNDAGFGDVHSVIGLVCYDRGHDLVLVPAPDPRFIPGRSCILRIDGRDAGVMGEIHPSLLSELGISRPASAFEILLEALGGDIQG